MWTKGERVLAYRGPGQHWYPGVIRHIQDDRYFVVYDDGEDGFVKDKEMLPFALEVGDRIDALAGDRREYEPARIVDKRDDQFRLQYADGKSAWTSFGRIRVQPEALKAKATSSEPIDWQIGDRVFACWFDLFWHTGTVLEVDGAEIRVLFDHGGVGSLSAQQVHAIELDEGDRVQVRWKAGNEFFPGKIARRDGDIVDIDYDDEDHETTLIRLVRVERDDWLPDIAPTALAQGDRALAQWFDGFWYPGIINGIEGKRVHILFDDNDQAHLTWDKIGKLEFNVGDRVLARWQGGPFYFPAEITKTQGERIHLHYEDGREEWSSIRLVRVER